MSNVSLENSGILAKKPGRCLESGPLSHIFFIIFVLLFCDENFFEYSVRAQFTPHGHWIKPKLKAKSWICGARNDRSRVHDIPIPAVLIIQIPPPFPSLSLSLCFFFKLNLKKINFYCLLECSLGLWKGSKHYWRRL